MPVLRLILPFGMCLTLIGCQSGAPPPSYDHDDKDKGGGGFR